MSLSTSILYAGKLEKFDPVGSKFGKQACHDGDKRKKKVEKCKFCLQCYGTIFHRLIKTHKHFHLVII